MTTVSQLIDYLGRFDPNLRVLPDSDLIVGEVGEEFLDLSTALDDMDDSGTNVPPSSDEDEGMQDFDVEVLRTVAVTVTVQGFTAEDAVNAVKQLDYPLPEIETGEVLDSWEFVVYASEGDRVELYRED